jgi:hypothetical protein
VRAKWCLGSQAPFSKYFYDLNRIASGSFAEQGLSAISSGFAALFVSTETSEPPETNGSSVNDVRQVLTVRCMEVCPAISQGSLPEIPCY